MMAVILHLLLAAMAAHQHHSYVAAEAVPPRPAPEYAVVSFVNGAVTQLYSSCGVNVTLACGTALQQRLHIRLPLALAGLLIGVDAPDSDSTLASDGSGSSDGDSTGSEMNCTHLLLSVDENGCPSALGELDALSLDYALALRATHRTGFSAQPHAPRCVAEHDCAVPMHPSGPLLLAARQEAVRRAFVHAWAGYEAHAFGEDVLHPLSGVGARHLVKMGETLVDSLDSLLLMGSPAQYARARGWVASGLAFGGHGQDDINLFETTIRVLGGLLSAYGLTGDGLYLDRAAQLANRLINSGAFDSTTGLPYGTLTLYGGGEGEGGGDNDGSGGNGGSGDVTTAATAVADAPEDLVVGGAAESLTVGDSGDAPTALSSMDHSPEDTSAVPCSKNGDSDSCGPTRGLTMERADADAYDDGVAAAPSLGAVDSFFTHQMGGAGGDAAQLTGDSAAIEPPVAVPFIPGSDDAVAAPLTAVVDATPPFDAIPPPSPILEDASSLLAPTAAPPPRCGDDADGAGCSVTATPAATDNDVPSAAASDEFAPPSTAPSSSSSSSSAPPPIDDGLPGPGVRGDRGHAYNPRWANGASSISEVATLGLELEALSLATGDPVYRSLSRRISGHLAAVRPPLGLFTLFIDPASGRMLDAPVSLGARGDSAYEYMLKGWIAGGGWAGEEARAEALAPLALQLVLEGRARAVSALEEARSAVRRQRPVGRLQARKRRSRKAGVVTSSALDSPPLPPPGVGELSEGDTAADAIRASDGAISSLTVETGVEVPPSLLVEPAVLTAPVSTLTLTDPTVEGAVTVEGEGSPSTMGSAGASSPSVSSSSVDAPPPPPNGDDITSTSTAPSTSANSEVISIQSGSSSDEGGGATQSDDGGDRAYINVDSPSSPTHSPSSEPAASDSTVSVSSISSDELSALLAAPLPSASLLRMYNEAVCGVMDTLLQASLPSHLLYVAEMLKTPAALPPNTCPVLSHKMDQLV